jgi:hypothetical protein
MNQSKRNGVACYYCRRSFDDSNSRTKDHVVAKSRGGFDREDNYVDSCWSCNQWKADKTLSAWLTEVEKWLKRGRHSEYTKTQLGQIVGNIKKLITELKKNKNISTHKIK